MLVVPGVAFMHKYIAYRGALKKNWVVTADLEEEKEKES